MRKNASIHKCLPVLLAALAFLVTGCPKNEYVIDLKPQGKSLERSLEFHRADGGNTNGIPMYEAFDPSELALIAAGYPTDSLQTKGSNCYVVQGKFTSQMPPDVGGAGTYTNLVTSLGTAGFYVERFRGTDDLAGIIERRIKAADQFADIFVGWSRMELRRKPNYEKLRHFLDVDFRRDLRNLTLYCWENQLVSDYKTNDLEGKPGTDWLALYSNSSVTEEFAVRFGQYLFERGYFRVGELPPLCRALLGDEMDAQAVRLGIQRVVARKMDVPDSAPIPRLLDILADEASLTNSFAKYLASTEAYRSKLKQWEKDKKLKPDALKPESPEAGADDVYRALGLFDDRRGSPDHLMVRLALPTAPIHSNGRWNDARKQVIWESNIESRTNAMHLPVTCYASWAQADESFQKDHFGKVALTGDELSKYCLWRSGLSIQRGNEWNAFLSGLKPGTELIKKLDGFRFSGESGQEETGNYPQELLKKALQ